jgi:hypothetical protein
MSYMSTQLGATRRSVLGYLGLAAGAAAAAIGLGAGVEGVARGEIASGLRMTGEGWRLRSPDLMRGQLPRRGDVVSVTGVLRDAAGRTADFYGTSSHLDTPGGHPTWAAAALETHTFKFADGTLVGMGTALAGEESVFAVVGGTGKYSGATGSYTAVQSPLETGGDGTAEFRFDIRLPGGR